MAGDGMRAQGALTGDADTALDTTMRVAGPGIAERAVVVVVVVVVDRFWSAVGQGSGQILSVNLEYLAAKQAFDPYFSLAH